MISFFFEKESRHANAKAQEAVDHMASFRHVERRFHSQDSNRQPLPWDLGISPPSSDSLRSSRTLFLSSCKGKLLHRLKLLQT